MADLIGIDVGGTNLRFGIVRGLQVIQETRVRADFAKICQTHPADEAWVMILSLISDHLAQLIAVHPDVQAVGIGFPGFIDTNSGKLSQSPNLPGLYNVDLAQDLMQRISLPIIVENDALAAAYGEYRLHTHDLSSMIYIGLGTGVGGGLVYAKTPFAGQHGVAMEVGHIIVEHNGRLCGCGNRGCLEQYASATGVSLSYELATGQHLTSDEIVRQADAGNPQAQAAYQLAGAALAQALAHIVKIVDVGSVVIGGGMSQAWPFMQDAFNQRLQADLIPVLRDKVTIYLSQCGDQAGIIGAALLAGLVIRGPVVN